MDRSIIKEVKSIYDFVKHVVVFVSVIGSALMLWNVGKIVTNTESPIVVVLTGSMEPAFYRGDLLLVTHFDEDMKAGDIIVFKVPNQDIPIVHRALILQQHLVTSNREYVPVSLLDKANEYMVKQPYGEEFSLLSKGDANPVDDRGLYPRGVYFINRKHIIGKIRAYCPYIGYLTIVLNEQPVLKYIVIGLMLLSVIISKDPENK